MDQMQNNQGNTPQNNWGNVPQNNWSNAPHNNQGNAPQNNQENKMQDNPQEKKEANILCWCSVACAAFVFFSSTITAIVKAISDRLAFGLIKNVDGVVTNILGTFDTIFVLAALVLMIIVRVKYPHSTFGKVLMWVYIVIAIGWMFLIFAAIIFFAIACKSCQGM